MAPKLSAPLPPSLRMSLRPNRATAPGAPDMPNPKRTSSVVQAEKEQKEREKEQKETEQMDKIKKLAAFEDEMQGNDAKAHLEANDPPVAEKQKALRKVATSAKEATKENETDLPVKQLDAPKKTTRGAKESASGNLLAGDDDVLSSATLFSGGGANHTRSSLGRNQATEDDEGKKKKMKKTEFRTTVIGNRQNNNGSQALPLKGKKRTIDSETIDVKRPADKKLKVAMQPAEGIRPDWSSTKKEKPEILTAKTFHGKITTQANKRQPLSANATPRVKDEEGDKPSKPQGSFSDADDTDERAALKDMKAQPFRNYGGGVTEKENKVQPMVGVVIKTESSLLLGQSGKIKKDSISNKDLPAVFQSGFRSRYVPLLRQFVGTLGAWENPSDNDIRNTFASAFPDYPSQLNDHLMFIVVKISDDRLSTWRNSFSSMALTVLNKLFVDLELKTPDTRAKFVEYMLGTDDLTCPFYYREISPKGKPFGLFQSDIVAATLSIHYTAILGLPQEQQTDARPVGALALTLQAIKRALLYNKTGTQIIPTGPQGHFSKNNWHERIERKDGHDVHIKASRVITKLISQLTDNQWNKIVEGAIAYAKQKRPEPTYVYDVDEAPSSDCVMVDGDESEQEPNEDEGPDNVSGDPDDDEEMYCSIQGSDI